MKVLRVDPQALTATISAWGEVRTVPVEERKHLYEVDAFLYRPTIGSGSLAIPGTSKIGQVKDDWMICCHQTKLGASWSFSPSEWRDIS